MTEKWTEAQILKATKVTFDDLLRVGYDLDRLVKLADASGDEFYINDVDTAVSIVARFISSSERDRKEVIRLGKCIERLHGWAVSNQDAVGAILVTKIKKTIIGE